MRNVKAGEPVKLENATDNELLFGEVAAQPLASLDALFSTVYQPLLENLMTSEVTTKEYEKCEPEQREEFMTQFKKFNADLSEAIHSLKSTVELDRIPGEIMALPDIQSGNFKAAASNPQVVEGLRKLLVTWTEKTNVNLVESMDGQHSTDGQHSVAALGKEDRGPRTELVYWRKRMQKLTGITERTKSRESKIVFGVLNAVPTDSAPNARTVFAALREWKATDIQMTEALNEAKDNVKYLATLEKFLEPLYSGTPQTIVDNLPALMNAVKMVHTIARYYNTTERMTTLFTKITNQMIMNCRRAITKEFTADLWSRDPESLCEDLQACLQLNEVYRAQYNETKTKLHAMPKGKQFDFSEPTIFGRFDLFCRRCFKLHDMFRTIKQFRALASHRFERMEELIQLFEKIVATFRNYNHDLLDFTSNKFDRNYVEFNVNINDLEAQLQRFINQAFFEISSSEQALDLHVKFMSILERESLQSDLKNKIEMIFRKYGQEIGKVRSIYQEQFMQPQIARNLPDIAGNIMWARHLLNRIESPMRRFLKYPDVFKMTDASLIVKSYNKLARTLIEFELRWSNIWKASVAAAKAGLQATLLVRSSSENGDEGGKLYVNFDFEILQLIRETKCLDRLGVEVPEGAKLVLLQGKKFKEYYAELSFLLKEYRRITGLVRPQLQRVLAPHFDHLEFVLRPGLTTLTWTSMNIGVYLHSVHSALSRFEQLVIACNDFIDNRIEANFKFISRLSLFDLPADSHDHSHGHGHGAVKDTPTLSLEDFVDNQELRVRAVAEILKEKGDEVESAVDEMLAAIVAFPLDSSIAPTDAADMVELKRAFCASLYHAVRNATRISLHSLKRRLQPSKTKVVVEDETTEEPATDSFQRVNVPAVGPKDLMPSAEDIERQKAAANRPDPLFEVKVSLGLERVEGVVTSFSGKVLAELEPSISEVQSELTKACLAALDCSKELKFWNLNPPRSVIAAQRGVDVADLPEDMQDIDEADRKSFYDELAADRELLKVLLLLNGSVERVRSEVSIHLDVFNGFDELWTVKPKAALKDFKQAHGNAPTIDDYELELIRIRKIKELADPQQAKTRTHVIGTLKINSENFLKKINDLCEQRILTIAGELHQGARADLDRLTQRVKDFEKKLSKNVDEGDIEALYAIMTALEDIRTMQSSISFEMTPMERKFLLLDNFYRPPPTAQGLFVGGPQDQDEAQMRITLRNQWKSVTKKADDRQLEFNSKQKGFKEELIKQINVFKNDVVKFRKDYDEKGPAVPGLAPKEASSRLRQFKEDLEVRQRKRQVYADGSVLFGLPVQAYPDLDFMQNQLEWLGGLYDLYNKVEETINNYMDVAFSDVSSRLDTMEREVDQFKSARDKLARELKSGPAYRDLSDRIENFEAVTPLLRDLIKPSMRELHWGQIEELLSRDQGKEVKLNVQDENFKLKSLLEANLPKYGEDISEITESAEKQASLEAQKKEAIDYWSTVTFTFRKWEGHDTDTAITKLADDLERLEEDQMLLNSIRANRHSAPFKQEVEDWYKILVDISNTIAQWMEVQKLWCGLEAVFMGGDIAKALPSEASKFQELNKNWVKIMGRASDTAKIKECCLDDLLLATLPNLKTGLEDCQKALDAYLETKRNRFPRFFFVANTALVKILSQGSVPEKLQDDFEKMFDALTSVHFERTDKKKIIGFRGTFGNDFEDVMLTNPVKCGESVETWLKALEVEMQSSVRRICTQAASELDNLCKAEMPLSVFNDKYIAQVSLLGIQLKWTMDVQEAIEKATNGALKDKTIMTTTMNSVNDMMKSLREMCLSDIPTKMKRTKVETLVTIHVHQKELFDKLFEAVRRSSLKSAQDFEWLKQTRLYWKQDKNDAVISIADVDFSYKHEFLGTKERLCITALTDRCYLTNSQALGMFYGGAPSGPAGTGKTETVKDMGRTIGVYVVVTNCSSEYRYRDMAKIFKGLCQSGLWGCFDEFNRIELEVLSVVAMQVESITQAKKQGVKTFFFPGGENEVPQKIPLVASCAYFITMNPGYAGRQELPENLKAQFRFVAMMVPDRATIIKVKLTSVGYGGDSAAGAPGSEGILAQKFKVLYGLCEEQLSKQRHYDFGLRNILSVLRTAGGVKRENRDADEEFLLMRTLRDMNLSKLVAEDTKLFESLLQDIFPAQKEIVPVVYETVEKAIDQVIAERSLVNHASWRLKIIQLYETSRVRHGFMLVGRTLTGKSTILDVLTSALTKPTEHLPKDDPSKMTYKTVKLNPKAITSKQMYGFDNAGTWVTGIFAELWTQCNDRKNTNLTNWLVCDGPVDAIWIEDLNTVLDDNKILTLPNQDRIPMSENCRIVFEVNDLDQASPATVSRAGIVYVSEADFGWEPLVRAWITQRRLLYSNSKRVEGKPNVGEVEAEVFSRLFEQYVGGYQDIEDSKTGEVTRQLISPLYKEINRNLRPCMPTSNSMMMMNTLSLLTALLKPALKDEADPTVPCEGVVLDQEGYLNVFTYALTWGIGGLYEPEDRIKFDAYLREVLQIPSPATASGEEGLTFFDFGLTDCKTRRWEKWQPKEVKLGKGPFSPASMLIPTVDSVRAEFILSHMSALNKTRFPVLNNYRSVLITGAGGTAKSSTVLMYMQNFNQEMMMSKVINFSSATKPDGLQNIIMLDSELEKTGSTFAPPNNRHLTFFFDDVSMPEVGKWGEQVTLELARQVIEQQGFYSLEQAGQFWNVDRLMYIGAMNHPGGGRNDVPPRFKSKFFTFNMVLPSLTSVDNIYGFMIRHRFTTKNGAQPKVVDLSKKLTASTIEVWDRVKRVILPTPARFHYVFNMRELSRIFTGILCTPLESIANEENLISLWQHECVRVLSDKLIRPQDKEIVRDTISQVAMAHFNDKLQQIASEPQFWANFLRKQEADEFGEVSSNLTYEKCTLATAKAAAEERLRQFNEEPKNQAKQMNLVFFDDALEHLLRISRIISTSRGSAMLVGVGGSGKQSLARLAAFITKMECHQMVVTKSFTEQSLTDDLFVKCKAAATGKPVCFILTDQEIKSESFLEFFNSLLSTGEYANMFPKDERDIICADVRNDWVKVLGSKDADPSTRELYQFAIRQLRENLHFALCFSPVGAKFPIRAQKFPAIFSCVTIDWYTAWPEEALIAVAASLVPKDKIRTDPESMKNLFVFMGSVQENVAKVCEAYYARFHRHVYVTPKSFLAFLKFFEEVYDKKFADLHKAETAVAEGLKKLAEAAVQVAEMGRDLKVKEESVNLETKETNKLIAIVEQKKAAAEKFKREVAVKVEDTERKKALVEKQKGQAEEELEVARPAFLNAIAAASRLKPSDVVEVKAMRAKLPPIVKVIFDCVHLLFKRSVDKVEPASFEAMKEKYNHIKDSFDTQVSKTLFSNDFVTQLQNFANNEKDQIDDETVELLEPYFQLKCMDPKQAKGASVAAAGVLEIVQALASYQTVAKKVRPLLNEVALQTANLEIALAEVAKGTADLKAAEEEVARLEADANEKKAALARLTAQAEALKAKMQKANNLVESLDGEKQRWTNDALTFEDRRTKLVGDVSVAAAFISYCGPFNSEFRALLRDKTFHGECMRLKVPTSDQVKVVQFLIDQTTIGEWNMQGLPQDDLSIENGIMVTEAKRFPLMIDPQIQGLQWIKSREKQHMQQTLHENSITGCVATVDHPKLRDRLLYCIENGYPFLIENVENEIDASLDPVLERRTVRKGLSGTPQVTLGDSTVPWHDKFKLYMTSRLGNPHFSPELQAKCTVIDFTVTLTGLQQQLLGRVLSTEQRALEQLLSDLVAQGTEKAKQLKDLDAKLLKELSEAEGDLVENDALIATLSDTKVTANNVQQALDEANERTLEIGEKRKQYMPVATRGSVLYFSMVEVQSINWMYNSSLAQFLEQFDLAIQRAERAQPTHVRVKKIVDKLTEMVYRYVNRGLFEKHKRTFLLMVVLKILLTDQQINGADVAILLRSAAGAEAETPNPLSKWLTNEQWNNVWALTKHQFNGNQGILRRLSDDMLTHEAEWKRWVEHNEPETLEIPSFHEALQQEPVLGPFVRLCIVRALREDRTRVATAAFVESTIGSYFVAPVTDSIESIWEESTNRKPVLYLLSPGADPTSAIDEFAKKKKKFPTEKVSMGEGQEKPAMRKMNDGFQEGVGSWVVLQNCHLGLDFMASIETILKDREIDEEFRLWITCEENNNFPIGLLQLAIKVTNEPPMGLKAGLQRTYATMITQETLDKVDDPKWRQVLYATAFMHSIVQERRKFNAIGWCIPYEFNNSDLEASLLFLEKHLSMVLPTGQPISWATVTYMVAEVQYGGRITDDLDRELFKQYAEIYLQQRIFEDKFTFNSVSPAAQADKGQAGGEVAYRIPSPTEERFGEIAFWREYIAEKIQPVDSPAAFGLHVNADLSFRRAEAKLMLDTIQSTLPRDTGSSSGISRDDQVKMDVERYLTQMPVNFNEERYRADIDRLEGPKKLYISDTNKNPQTGMNVPLNVFLLQEVQRMEKIIALVASNLVAIKSAIEGTVIMTPALQEDIERIFDQKVPSRWTHDTSGAEISWLSPSLARWMKELTERYQQLALWLATGRPKVFRLASFLNPQGFLTAMKQEVTRMKTSKADTWALDEVDYIAEVTRIDKYDTPKDNSTAPKLRDERDDGVYVHSLKIEGARYQDKLEESRPRVPISDMPIVFVGAAKVSKSKDGKESTGGNVYMAPVYKYANRTDRYFIFRMPLKYAAETSAGGAGGSALPAAAHWKLRGVALLCHSD